MVSTSFPYGLEMVGHVKKEDKERYMDREKKKNFMAYSPHSLRGLFCSAAGVDSFIFLSSLI